MDTLAAHQHFSADCFNETWKLLDKKDRSRDEDRVLLASAHASLYHWLNRDDCSPVNLSVGLWQISRVYAELQSPLESMKYAQNCLQISIDHSLSSFYRAYAHEAVARSAYIDKNYQETSFHLNKASNLLSSIKDPSSKELLDTDLKDLDSLLESASAKD